VLCLGNELIADDGVGPAVAAELRNRGADVDLAESALDGLALLDDLVGADRLVVVDAILTGSTAPGSVRVVTEQELAASPGGWQHALGLFDTIRLGRALGLAVPREVVLVVVEAADLVCVGGPLTPEVRGAVPRVASLVEQLLEDDA
jgi:hydrogenase maturation protease